MYGGKKGCQWFRELWLCISNGTKSSSGMMRLNKRRARLGQTCQSKLEMPYSIISAKSQEEVLGRGIEFNIACSLCYHAVLLLCMRL